MICGKPGRLLPLCEGGAAWQALSRALLLVAMTFAAVRAARRFPICCSGGSVSYHLVARYSHRKGRRDRHGGRHMYITLVGPLVAPPGESMSQRGGSEGKRPWRPPASCDDRPGGRADIHPGGHLEKQRHLFSSRPRGDGEQFMAQTNCRWRSWMRAGCMRPARIPKMAAKIRPDFPNARYNLGVIRMRTGQKRRGDGSFQGRAAFRPQLCTGIPLRRAPSSANGESPPRPCSTSKEPWRAGAPTRRSSPPLPMHWP